MKLKRPNLLKLAATGLLGLAFAHAVHAATLLSDDFDASPVDQALGYSYWDARNGDPTSWSSTGNWWYNSSYDPGRRPTPRSGEQALHGFGQYNFQVLTDTFQSGMRYTVSAWVQGDGDAVDESDSVWLYVYDGDAEPVPFAQDGTSFDDASLYAIQFNADGTTVETINSGGGTIGPFSGFNRSGDSDWTQVSITLEVNEGDAWDGNPIGAAFYGEGDAAFDDVTVESSLIPEPGAGFFLGLAGLGAFFRRRRR